MRSAPHASLIPHHAMPDPQTLGIFLVHNEDRFLRRAVANVLAFCDRILIAEHRSTDATWEIAQDLAREHPKIEAHRIRDPRESNDMLQPFAGTRTWALAVDGDEIYDPAGLAWTRVELARGAWDRWWVVFGNVLNCTEIDEAAKIARGFLAPPCRSMTKLYNLAAVERLDPDAPQRLMGRHNLFQPGRSASERWELYKELGWEEARFRCLHACFVPRSSAEAHAGRENISELRRRSLLAWFRRVAAQLAGRGADSRYKADKYKRGPLVTVDAAPFFAADT